MKKTVTGNYGKTLYRACSYFLSDFTLKTTSYALGSLSIKIAQSLMFPITLVYLSPKEYALWGLINAGITFLSIALGAGIQKFFEIEFFRQPAIKKPTFIVQAIISYSMQAVPAYSIFACCAPMLNNFLLHNALSLPLFYAILGLCFLYVIQEILTCALKNTERFLVLNSIQCISIAANFFTTVSLLLYKWGLASVVIGALIEKLLFIIGTYCCVVTEQIDYQAVFHTNFILKGIRFMPQHALWWLLTASDRWFLSFYVSLETLAPYSCAAAITTFFDTTVLQSITSVYTPLFFKKLSLENGHNHTRHHRTILGGLCSGLLLYCVLFYAAKPTLIHYLPVYYRQALDYVLPLSIGVSILSALYLLLAHDQFNRRASSLVVCQLLIYISKLVIGYLLVNNYRLIDYTWGTVGAYMLGLIYACYCVLYRSTPDIYNPDFK